jgi:N-acetylneuraminic acid mutarotase
MTLTRRSALLGAAGLLGACATRAPSQPAWASAPPMPWAAQEIYAAVAGGKVYVAGGLTGPAPGSRSLGILDRTGVYDPRTDRWSEGPRLPQPIHHPVLAAVGGRVFAIGGFRAVPEGQWSGQREVLALDGDRWMSAGALPAPQSESVALEQGGRIHLLTGRTPGEARTRTGRTKPTPMRTASSTRPAAAGPAHGRRPRPATARPEQ